MVEMCLSRFILKFGSLGRLTSGDPFAGEGGGYAFFFNTGKPFLLSDTS